MTTGPMPGRTAIAMWSTILFLILVVLVFALMRVATDVPHLIEGTQPPADSFESRYVDHPVLSYAHLVPGVLYLLGAPFQAVPGGSAPAISLGTGAWDGWC